jgi:dinuclear metal center YbgI/SA1388 family protein
MTVKELYDYLNEKIPPSLSCEWDNDGLMCCPKPDRAAAKILVALDISEEIVERAVSENCDVILSHHPLVFSSQKSLVPHKYTQNKLIKLIKAGVSVFSFHTRLDAVQGGVNDVLCNLLGLENITIDPVEPVGRIAETSEKIDVSTFVKNVKSSINTPFVLYNGENDVKRVYVVGGDGKDMIGRALELGADTLLTGRASYNTIIDAKDMGLNIIEAGHFFTENPVCTKIESDIKSINSDIKTEVFSSYDLKIM